MAGKRAGAVACGVLVLAGCGGDTRRGPAPPASRGEFVAQANRICRITSAQGERVAALRRLRPPAPDRELYAHWLAAEQDALEAANALADPSQAPEGDPLVPLAIAEGKITGYARRLGAEACTRPRAGRIPP